MSPIAIGSCVATSHFPALKPPLRLILVEDDPDTARALQRDLGQDPRVTLLSISRDLRHGLRAVEEHEFDIALVDIGLPDGSGLDLIRRIGVRRPDAESLVISVFGEERTVLQAIEAGASGYLIKGTRNDGIIEALLDVSAGGSPISPVIARKLLNRLRPRGDGAQPGSDGASGSAAGLTVREITILRLVSQGFVVDEIARKLFLSPHTVSTHVKNLYRKLHVSTRGQAVHEAYRLGLI